MELSIQGYRNQRTAEPKDIDRFSTFLRSTPEFVDHPEAQKNTDSSNDASNEPREHDEPPRKS